MTAKLAVLLLSVAVIALTIISLANGSPVDRVAIMATVAALVLMMLVRD